MKTKTPAQAAATARVLDNQEGAKLADYLLAKLPKTEKLRLVSAYFSVYGYAGLASALDKVKTTKFLFGEPASAADIITGGKKRQHFVLGEKGLFGNEDFAEEAAMQDILRQRVWAERCAEWVREKTEVRTIDKSNFMHGKMWHLHFGDDKTAATVGSSNFTRRGLGLAQNSNLELNISVEERATRDKLAEWFDDIWNNEKLTKDAKDDLLAALARLYEEYSPEFLYYKTLFELFKKDLEAESEGNDRFISARLRNSKIWKSLYQFQKDGAKSVISRLLRHGGCILADSVGLGKTYTALAVIKFFELRNERVLVLCPKKLENNWRIYQSSAEAANNPFAEDRFGYARLAHTDLTRTKGEVGNIDLANFNWGAFDLVVIDESHNFRNESKTVYDEETGETKRVGRHERLLETVMRAGGKTKALLLSATPVNTSLHDLRNQIYVMTEGQDDAFADEDALGVASIGAVIKGAQKSFEEWEKEGDNRKKSDLLGRLGGDFLGLLGGLTIARSRRQIERFYGEYAAKEHGKFPRRAAPKNMAPHTDIDGELSYKSLYNEIKRFGFRIYQPSAFVEDATAKKRLAAEKKRLRFNQETREHFLVYMMRINFLKRLESSAHAFTLTLSRGIERVEKQISHIDKFLQTRQDAPAGAAGTDFSDEDAPNPDTEEDEDFVVNAKAKNPYHLRELDVEAWREALTEDLAVMTQTRDGVAKITAARDGKLKELMTRIEQKAREGKKLLVFTTFKDTALYLYDQVCAGAAAAGLGIKIAAVAGDETKTQHGKNGFVEILDNFSPVARGRGEGEDQDEIDILIATDCISEGQNLQDCDAVLNYDIHWNPVRVIQRFGRVDRIGSKHKEVGMVNFWPVESMEEYLKLRRRVTARMALVEAAGTEGGGMDEEEFNKAAAEEAVAETETPLGLKFREEQTKKIRDEVLDLEDLDDTVSMGDLTLNYFLTQLLRYLRKNEEALKNAENGAYAVANGADGGKYADLARGVIFFFRQTNAAEKSAPNPTHPFYFAHVGKNGVLQGHAEAGGILRLFEQLAVGKTEPFHRLCDSFVKKIKSDEGIAHYGKMAQQAIDGILTKHKADDAKQLRANPNALLTPDGKRPAAGNLELITWLVILNAGE